ncbi:MAG: RNase adapter RapZ [Bryobacter sp.]|nr:RNase adapter RapZ [Bryobacter sp.]
MNTGQAELVIITGLSGSGKGTVLKCFEDLGYYAVDNLPLELFRTFAELTKDSPNIRKAALVVDIREGEALDRFPQMYREVSTQVSTRLLFLDADDDTLLRRFSETRRPHPLGKGGNLLRSVKAERDRLAEIRGLASLLVNTSKLNVHELRAFIEKTFGDLDSEGRTTIFINSFGFRHGVPHEADLVFDVRFLPNPNYIPEFKPHTGKHPSVARYIRGFPQTQEFLKRVEDLLIFLLPHYHKEGKSYLTIAFGCTGGQHRSVMIAEAVSKALRKRGYANKVTHRDAKPAR